MTINFASDNHAGIHPDILSAITKVNNGHVKAYGDDPYTEEAVKLFKNILGEDIDVFFVFNGTGANVTALSCIINSFNSVICSDFSHINVDECGAPEKFTGCKLITIPTTDGKITAEEIEKYLLRKGDQHASQPKVISITQSTEYGTVYTVEEIKKITDFAHKNNLYVHVDGARIANAVVSLNTDLKKMLVETKVDILSFGGTKNGLMIGEAVVFFNKQLAENFKYVRKQSMQLASKMRFISAQFIALLTDGLWLKNAEHSNNMAKLLYENLKDIPQIKITQQPQANSVFAIIPKQYIEDIQKHYYFYVWNEITSEVRLMCAFDTTKEDVLNFSKIIKEIVS